jgi:LemA protein
MVYVIPIIVVLLAAAALFLYNRLVRLRNKVDNAWHQIDVELKRRYDLVPELAIVVQGYAAHEKAAFESIASARASAMRAASPAEKAPAEDILTSAVGNVLVVAEAYPALKAEQEYRKLQAGLTETETRIAGSRKYYNGAVMYYENARQSVPGKWIAAAFPKKFGPREYFEIEDPADRLVPGAQG